MALLSARQSDCYSPHHGAGGVLRRETHDNPAEFGEVFEATNVPVALATINAVVGTFVLECDLQILVAHVEFGDQNAVFVVDRYLGLRSRETSPNNHQPQPCLLGRFRARVDKVERDTCSDDPSPALMAFGQ